VRWYFSAPAVITLVALLVANFTQELDPSPELLRTMAGIGVSLFLAYVIEASWLAQRLKLESDEHSEIFLEVITGIAVCGLFAIVIALFLSEHSVGRAFGLGKRFYFWWASIALGTLGLLVAVQPALAHELGRGDTSEGDGDSADGARE
jgi:hypothetical protein